MTHYDPKDHTLLERVEALEELCSGIATIASQAACNANDIRLLSRQCDTLAESTLGWMDRLTKRIDTTDNDVAITIRSMVDLSERIDEVEAAQVSLSENLARFMDATASGFETISKGGN